MNTPLRGQPWLFSKFLQLKFSLLWQNTESATSWKCWDCVFFISASIGRGCFWIWTVRRGSRKSLWYLSSLIKFSDSKNPQTKCGWWWFFFSFESITHQKTSDYGIKDKGREICCITLQNDTKFKKDSWAPKKSREIIVGGNDASSVFCFVCTHFIFLTCFF